MPGGDKTGPNGTGPMTGRGEGLCAGNGTPGRVNQPLERGFTGGRSMNQSFVCRGRRGRRSRLFTAESPGHAQGQELADHSNTDKKTMHYLKSKIDNLESRLNEIYREIKRQNKNRE